MRARGRNHGRREAGRMNGHEEKYAFQLQSQRNLGVISWFRFEPIKLRLADKTFYSPDFMVQLPDGLLEFHEVKGFWEDDARVKIKVAAEQYPEFQFVGVTWNKRDGWKEERF